MRSSLNTVLRKWSRAVIDADMAAQGVREVFAGILAEVIGHPPDAQEYDISYGDYQHGPETIALLGRGRRKWSPPETEAFLYGPLPSPKAPYPAHPLLAGLIHLSNDKEWEVSPPFRHEYFAGLGTEHDIALSLEEYLKLATLLRPHYSDYGPDGEVAFWESFYKGALRAHSISDWAPSVKLKSKSHVCGLILNVDPVFLRTPFGAARQLVRGMRRLLEVR